MADRNLEMFMVKLRRLVYENYYNNISTGSNPFIQARKHEIQLLYEELGSLIGSCSEDEDELEDAGNGKRRLIKAAREAEDTVDTFISSAIIKNSDKHRRMMDKLLYRLLCYLDIGSYFKDVNRKTRTTEAAIKCSLKDFKGVMDNLKSIRAEIISNKKGNRQDMMVSNKFEATGTNCSSGNTTVNLSGTEHEEFIVGFENEALLILDRLTGHRKKLDIISIMGMGGQGKTTLANKIFNDSLVRYHFHIRGWVSISQTYSKQGLLLQLLESIGKSVDEAASESKLYELLFKSLKGKRYLIVIDDIWSPKAWDDVGICFPDDKTGSRVLVTTRLTEVASHASQGGFTHNLGLLTKDQSWELLCRKTFRGHECPESLIETGKHIAIKCGGLPLALVVIAGILVKGEKRKDLWEKIAKRVGSCIINDPVGCLDTLALSYDHLPSKLKKCFLYTGGFPEDYKIQVRRLIRLWMAEGFIKEAGQRSLEEEGEYYLMDLIDRNLLIVADKSSNGGVNSCRLHDLLREVCLKKAFEENFFKRVNFSKSHRNLGFDSVSSIVKQQRIIFTDSEDFGLDFAFLCFYDSRPPNKHERVTSLPLFLLLRVLDLQNIPRVDFSNISQLLFRLRYLAVWSYDNESSFSKTKFWSLQTLIIKGIFQSFSYSANNMLNLRHLRCDRIYIPIDFSVIEIFHLQTISRLILDRRTRFLLELFPDIKKLGCSISSESSIDHGLLSFPMLTHLEALNIDTDLPESLTFANPIRFPETLRKLTLEGLCLPWSHMSTIQQLPKLEVLKLLYSSFVGHMWETGDEQFHELKYLELSGLNIHVWDASSSSFPHLRKLAVRRCGDLSEIPLALGNISTLEQIEIDDLNPDVLDSVNRIQEAQHEIGNYDIHVSIN
ncbi:putative late blight resistance protein homolog R1A-3 [Bidens hawaiensis]|uniref:putative late blight resistance protein homolog R1A-3 n=1 Tax=Bidens hawaiensis TaxID=980011 RepID=UPI00404B5F50